MNIIDTNLNFKSLSYTNNDITVLLLHHAEWKTCSVEQIHEAHKNRGWAGIGYHYFVRKDGRIYKGRPDRAIGSHCKGHNTGTVAICAEGDYNTEQMPEAQKNAIIELGIYLWDKYSLKDVRGHKEVPYDTDCPGKNYPLQEIKTKIRNKQAVTEHKSNFKPLPLKMLYDSPAVMIRDGFFNIVKYFYRDQLITAIDQKLEYYLVDIEGVKAWVPIKACGKR